MKNIYNYEKNIKVITTPNEDKVITMNKEIFVVLTNQIYNAVEYLEEKGLDASAEDIKGLWNKLVKDGTTMKDLMEKELN